MTNVLMTADSVGGVWTYALELIDALAPHDVQVTLAIMGPAPDARQCRALRDTAVHAAHHLHVALEWTADPWTDVDAAGAELLALARQADADVVHLNGFVHAALPWERPVVVVAHSDVMSWWHHVRDDEPPATWRTYRERVGRGLRAASAVVALTASGGRDLTREYEVEPTTCIPNGRRREWVRALAKEPFVLGAGRLWDDAKNLGALEHAAIGLDWPVAIAGPLPPGRTAAPSAAAGRGATALRVDGPVLLGPLPFTELAAWMARATVFAAPARYEPFGLVALEAAIAGCALVLGDIDSAHDVWGDAALYVDPADANALHKALQQLCRDPQRCAALAGLASDRARELTPALMAEAYVDLYDALLAPAEVGR